MYADLKQKKADTRTPSSKLLKKDYSLTEKTSLAILGRCSSKRTLSSG